MCSRMAVAGPNFRSHFVWKCLCCHQQGGRGLREAAYPAGAPGSSCLGVQVLVHWAWEAGPGAPARRRLGGAGREERLDPRRERGPQRWRAGRPGRGARGHLGARPRSREGCGRDWGNPGSRLESSGGELRAGPAIVSRGRTGRLRRPGISEAKHAHARRKVLAGRSGRSFRPPVPGLPAARPRTVRRRRQPLRCAPRRVRGSTAPGLLFERGERCGAVPGASLEMVGV